jgi:hypothetical protein
MAGGNKTVNMDFSGNVKTLVDSVDKLEVKLEQLNRTSQRGARKSKQAQRENKESFEQTGQAVGKFEEKVMQLGAAVVAAFSTQKIIEFRKQIVEAQNEFARGLESNASGLASAALTAGLSEPGARRFSAITRTAESGFSPDERVNIANQTFGTLRPRDERAEGVGLEILQSAMRLDGLPATDVAGIASQAGTLARLFPDLSGKRAFDIGARSFAAGGNTNLAQSAIKAVGPMSVLGGDGMDDQELLAISLGLTDEFTRVGIESEATNILSRKLADIRENGLPRSVSLAGGGSQTVDMAAPGSRLGYLRDGNGVESLFTLLDRAKIAGSPESELVKQVLGEQFPRFGRFDVGSARQSIEGFRGGEGTAAEMQRRALGDDAVAASVLRRRAEAGLALRDQGVYGQDVLEYERALAELNLAGAESGEGLGVRKGREAAGGLGRFIGVDEGEIAERFDERRRSGRTTGLNLPRMTGQGVPLETRVVLSAADGVDVLSSY